MSGDVQPRKRKDKRKRKAQLEALQQEEYREERASLQSDYSTEEEPYVLKEELWEPSGDEQSEQEIPEDDHHHGNGGSIVAKIVFFLLFGLLVVVAILIVTEYQGTKEVDIPVAESQFAPWLEGWVDESPPEHDEHEHAVEDEHEEGDEHGEHEDEEHDEEDDEHEHSEEEGDESIEIPASVQINNLLTKLTKLSTKSKWTKVVTKLKQNLETILMDIYTGNNDPKLMDDVNQIKMEMAKLVGGKRPQKTTQPPLVKHEAASEKEDSAQDDQQSPKIDEEEPPILVPIQEPKVQSTPKPIVVHVQSEKPGPSQDDDSPEDELSQEDESQEDELSKEVPSRSEENLIKPPPQKPPPQAPPLEKPPLQTPPVQKPPQETPPLQKPSPQTPLQKSPPQTPPLQKPPPQTPPLQKPSPPTTPLQKQSEPSPQEDDEPSEEDNSISQEDNESEEENDEDDEPSKESKEEASDNKPSRKEYGNAEITNDDDYQIREELDQADQILEASPEHAIRRYDNILKRHPKSPRALYGRAKSLDRESEKTRSNSMLEESITGYRSVLDLGIVPDKLYYEAGQRCIERMRFRGFHNKAVRVQQMMSERFPNDVNIFNQMAVTYLMLNQPKDAKTILENILTKWPNNGFAKVHYGFILKTVDLQMEKAVKYLQEGISSREEGTIDGRFFFQLGDALARLGKENEALEVYERGVKEGLFLSKYQRSLYNVNRLKGQPWWTTQETTYLKQFSELRRNWQTIRDEGKALLNQESLFQDESENLRDSGDWKQYELYARGQRISKACQRTPKTCSLIESFMEARSCTRGQVKFSVMHPGTHVWAHTGPTNCRLRAHLGLIVPPGPRIRVANITKTWKEGDFIIFDDSFEHEVWHNGTSVRLVLIVDVWHPELTDNERRTLPAI